MNAEERLIESMTFTFIFEILSEGSGTEKLNELVSSFYSSLCFTLLQEAADTCF